MDYGENDVSNVSSDGVFPDSVVSFENELLVYETRVSGRLLELPGGPVSFSIGGLYREEDYNSDQNDSLFVGDRSVTAGYVEILTPIIGADNALPFVKRLDLSLAGRYEDYSDVGDSLDPKIGVFLEVSDEFSLRASYSESFRAPDLQALNTQEEWFVLGFPQSFVTAFPPPSPSPLLPFPGVLYAYRPANPDLASETAESWSVGLTFRPAFFDGLTVQGNFFDIAYEDRIEIIGPQTVFSDASLTSLVDFAPLTEVQSLFDSADAGEIELINPFGAVPEDVQLLLNAGSLNLSQRNVRGFDLNVQYITDTEIGRFSAAVNASYLVDYVQKLSNLSPSVEQVDVLYRPVDFKMRANFSWSADGFTAFAALNYVDGYRDDIDSSVANGVDAWTTIDLSLVYDTGDRFDSALLNDVRFGFNVTNLFDNDPPFVATPFGLNYDSANANPFNRQASLSVSKAF